MTTTTAAPRYEDFLHSVSPLRHEANAFVATLTAGVPVMMPEAFQGGIRMGGRASVVTRAARVAGLTVKYVRFGEAWWACRLKDADIKAR